MAFCSGQRIANSIELGRPIFARDDLQLRFNF
jgi:hypothetical protein